MIASHRKSARPAEHQDAKPNPSQLSRRHNNDDGQEYTTKTKRALFEKRACACTSYCLVLCGVEHDDVGVGVGTVKTTIRYPHLLLRFNQLPPIKARLRVDTSQCLPPPVTKPRPARPGCSTCRGRLEKHMSCHVTSCVDRRTDGQPRQTEG